MELTKVIGRGLGIQGDTVAGDDAALGFTSTEGLILTGQGSTGDVTIKNDADALVAFVPTGTDDLRMPDAAQLQLGNGGDFKLYHDGSNNIVLGNGSHPMAFYTNDVLRQTIDANGHITQPYQPAFQVRPSSQQNSLATNDVLAFGTEVFDNNSDFSSNTFTAPVTGKYQINAQLRIDNCDQAASYNRVYMESSNRFYEVIYDHTKLSGDPSYWQMNIHVLADMDANDTLFLKWSQSGGSNQAQATTSCVFSGYLVC